MQFFFLVVSVWLDAFAFTNHRPLTATDLTLTHKTCATTVELDSTNQIWKIVTCFALEWERRTEKNIYWRIDIYSEFVIVFFFVSSNAFACSPGIILRRSFFSSCIYWSSMYTLPRRFFQKKKTTTEKLMNKNQISEQQKYILYVWSFHYPRPPAIYFRFYAFFAVVRSNICAKQMCSHGISHMCRIMWN